MLSTSKYNEVYLGYLVELPFVSTGSGQYTFHSNFLTCSTEINPGGWVPLYFEDASRTSRYQLSWKHESSAV